MTRYEALDAPSSSDEQAWRTVLQRAYTSHTYLTSRLTNLSLLETYGKNAWLIGNSQLETLLRDLEKEVEGLKREGEEVEAMRRGTQEGVGGEMAGLVRAWREGVGRLVEVQAAAEGVRREVLERRRAGAR